MGEQPEEKQGEEQDELRQRNIKDDDKEWRKIMDLSIPRKENKDFN